MRLAYGCMGLGSGSPHPTEEDVDRAEQAVLAAYELGIRQFDHADNYGAGSAETVFGRVLKRHPGLRETLTIQTKCGIVLGGAPDAEPHGGNAYDLSHEAILTAVAGSLERLGIDHVDRLLLHRPDPLMVAEEVADAFDTLYRDGRVVGFGVSNMGAAQMAHLARALRRPIEVDQVELSLAHRDLIEAGVLVNHAGASTSVGSLGTLEHCVSEAITIQAYGSLAQGRYTGARPTSDADRATAGLVGKYAAELGTTPESVVVGWLLRHPAMIVAVVGTTSPERIRACGDAEHVAAAMSREQWWSLWTTARGEPVP
ncbi:aldo/keto reductase [Mumia flava]|uniref:aldo/keto reductase n=1 Tax=Mumia flava TaxID=1348852 RepID=UPI001B80A48F|nr:aldo/keto reductase [Mumia flava]